jgi:hypothetical protein
MGFQKMMEHVQQGQRVRLIPALLSPVDVIHDHVADFLHAVLSFQKVLSKRGSGYFWQVLVLGDCENLFLGQPA